MTPLPPGLVLAVIDVESRFDRWAVSNAGAVGLMQVMPFWPERLGMRRYELVHNSPNIRMGCAILRFYLQQEHNDYARALARYNGSVGRRNYSDLVLGRWARWTGADDLGAPPPHHPVVKALARLSDWRVAHLHRRDLRGDRTDPQPSDEVIDGRLGALGQHLDPAVGQIARIPGDAQLARAERGRAPIEHALHPSAHPTDPGHHAQDRF